jgi:predicted CopG family antitoxin
MPSRSISIKEEIYNQLYKYRLKNESFSEAIKRLLESNDDILDLAGAWKKNP